MQTMKRTFKRFSGSRFGRRYIGDRAFYMAVLGLIVPVVIQNSISNFVSLLDNIMVGAASTEQMNGVSIGNQLIFVFNLCIFGGMSGATIFAAQYYGAKDEEGVRNTFRYSLWIAAIISLLAIIVLGVFRTPLISLYINDVESTGGAEETLSAGIDYVTVMLLGLIPFAVSQAYAGILRVSGETRLPMTASVVSVLTNLCLNYVLIFGHFGFPAMKARGAAIATVISRYVEMLIIVIVTHARIKRSKRYPFLWGAYATLRIPAKLTKRITVRGFPLLVNETLWSTGMATLTRLYSLRGLNAVAANTINSTLINLFNVFFLSIGTAASVLVGRALGSSEPEDAREKARKIIFFELLVSLLVGGVLYAVAPALPRLYTEANADVRAIAVGMIRVSACTMPLLGFAHCAYFILRSGGRTGITFLFDSFYTWIVPIPIVYALIHFTDWGIVAVFAAYNASEIIKDVIGYVLLKKGVWIRNIVSASNREAA